MLLPFILNREVMVFRPLLWIFIKEPWGYNKMWKGSCSMIQEKSQLRLQSGKSPRGKKKPSQGWVIERQWIGFPLQEGHSFPFSLLRMCMALCYCFGQLPKHNQLLLDDSPPEAKLNKGQKLIQKMGYCPSRLVQAIRSFYWQHLGKSTEMIKTRYIQGENYGQDHI